MSKIIKFVIGGREYTLKGEDEKLIRSAAEEVNNQIEKLRGKAHDESSATLSVLAALNIAEKYYEGSQNRESEQRYLVSELNSMSEFLMNSLNRSVKQG